MKQPKPARSQTSCREARTLLGIPSIPDRFTKNIEVREGARPDKPFSGKVLICSYGLYWQQITLETLSALRKADVIYADAIDEVSFRPLQEHCRAPHFLEKMFPADGRVPREVIEEKAQCVVREAAAGRIAAVITYGHPTFLCSLTDRLTAACREQGISYKIFHAVSSLGSVLGEIGQSSIPPEGLRLYSVLSWDRRMAAYSPYAPVLFFDLHALQDPQLCERFVCSLTEVYPAGHRVRIILSPCISQQQSLDLETTLDELGGNLGKTDTSICTLFVPPLPSPEDAGRGRRSQKPEKHHA